MLGNRKPQGVSSLDVSMTRYTIDLFNPIGCFVWLIVFNTVLFTVRTSEVFHNQIPLTGHFLSIWLAISRASSRESVKFCLSMSLRASKELNILATRLVKPMTTQGVLDS